MADAAHWVLSQPCRECSGNFFIDEDVLRRAGVSDLRKYAVDPQRTLRTDLFLDQ
jgi:citronellol/citronellal dehydrogenase